MFDTKKYNPNCEFNGEIVDYLYDEFSNLEKTDFEKHLADCSSCVEEVAAFGFVRSSIQNWKAIDFDNLSYPKIEIEFEPIKQTVYLQDSGLKNLTLAERFSELLSPLVNKTAAGFAAIAIIFGLGWFMFSSISNETFENVVDNNLKKSDSKTNVINDGNTLTPETAKTEDNQATDNSLVEKKIDSQNSEITNKLKSLSKEKVKQFQASPAKPNNSSNQNNILSEKSADPKITNRNRKPKSAVPNDKKPVNIEQAPSLIEFAVDKTEDEIRLSDIFDEVGSED